MALFIWLHIGTLSRLGLPIRLKNIAGVLRGSIDSVERLVYVGRMLEIILLDFALSLPNAKFVPEARLRNAVEAAAEVARTEKPLPFRGLDEPERRLRTGQFIVMMAFFESGFTVGALGDGGQSCGMMQTKDFWDRKTKTMLSSCVKVLKSAKESYLAGLRIFHVGIRDCKSLQGSISAYATGRCDSGSTLVKRRCAAAKIQCD